jgi:hypothetical protein
MIATIQPRHKRLWRAEQDGDWEFAAYEPESLSPEMQSRNTIKALACLSSGSPGLFPGFCDSFHRTGHIGVKDMGVAECALDVAVIQGLLHELEIAGLAQELRAGSHGNGSPSRPPRRASAAMPTSLL